MRNKYFFFKNIIIIALICACLCLIIFASNNAEYSRCNIPATIRGISSDEPIEAIKIPGFVEEMYVDLPITGDDPVVGEFSCEVSESDPVDDSYFDDAVFIGDSRTVGMGMFGNIKSNYYAKVSLKIDTVFNSAFITTDDSDTPLTVLEALEEKPIFKKVYISFGINELGYNRNVFINCYKLFVDQVRERLPNAIIYVQSVFPVSEAVSEKNRYGVNNEAVVEVNEAIKKMAIEKNLYYLDTYTLLADENGALPANISSDGIHLGPGKYSVMVSEYIRTHTANVQIGPVDYGNGYILDFKFSLD